MLWRKTTSMLLDGLPDTIFVICTGKEGGSSEMVQFLDVLLRKNVQTSNARYDLVAMVNKHMNIRSDIARLKEQ